MVVDKPIGMPTVPPPEVGPGEDHDSLFALVKRYVRDQKKRRGTRVWIIHRLDKESSGLLVFAKTERAYEMLKEEFRTKRTHRLYAAVVEGELGAATDTENAPGLASAMPSGTLRSFLVEDETGRVRSVSNPTGLLRTEDGGGRGRDTRRPARGPGLSSFGADVTGQARLAVTHYRVRAKGHGMTLVHLRLETGRKHQIRVHLSDLKHPIVGDRKYGAQTDPLGRVCLHAFELGFQHPGTNAGVRFRSPVPPAFFRVLGKKAGDEAKGDDRDSEFPENQTRSEPHEGAKAAAHAKGVESTKAPPAPKSSLASPAATRIDSSWDHVAEWYDDLIEERKSDHHEKVIVPGVLRLLDVTAGQRVLDVACGQGAFCRQLAGMGVEAVGIDAATRLIEAARKWSKETSGVLFEVADATTLAARDLGEFDSATCIMALMNMEPLAPVFAGIAAKLRAGGRFVGVILHPAFRAPGQTAWGWDEGGDGVTKGRSNEEITARGGAKDRKRGAREHDAALRQYRRVDGYLSAAQREIVMNPGAVSSGETPVTTLTFHRPIQTYIRAMAENGLLIDALEEWPSARTSEAGPRAGEENRARREIPMFLALRGRKGP
jgi:23S rRNA-/tRNA-specific pseudouridylate synthase/SAM-dependent methyltransferase